MMDSMSLPGGLKEACLDQAVLLSFSGPVSRSLFEQFGVTLQRQLQMDRAPANVAKDVFEVYVEMTQSIRQYVQARGLDELDASVAMTIRKDERNRYVLSTGSLMDAKVARSMANLVEQVAPMDREQLRMAYEVVQTKAGGKESDDVGTGLGLGLLYIARKVSHPLSAVFTELPSGQAFFSLRAVV